MRDRAVVIGAGMAGLFAARVLADHYKEVHLLERDAELGSVTRKGAAQGDHLHVLLKRGQEILTELFPGIDQKLEAASAPRIDWGNDTAWLNPFGWTPRFATSLVTRSCSRPLLERITREELLRRPNVRLELGVHVTPTTLFDADIVVNATGRSGIETTKLPRVVSAGLGYASRRYHLPRASRLEWRQLYIQMSLEGKKRGGVVCPIENGTFLVTLIGIGEDAPTIHEDDFLPFAKSLRSPTLYEALRAGEPLSPVRTYRKTDNRLHSPREGFALGDAVCSLNPVYGQGMTVAALAAKLLPRYLDDSRGYQRALARLVRFPWKIATTQDSFLIRRTLKRAVTKPPVHHAFLEVLHMRKSPLSLVLA